MCHLPVSSGTVPTVWNANVTQLHKGSETAMLNSPVSRLPCKNNVLYMTDSNRSFRHFLFLSTQQSDSIGKSKAL